MTPAQCRAARGLLGISQESLAGAAKVAKKTIADFETSNRVPMPRTVEAIQSALEAAGVLFIAKNGGGSGVRLRVAEE